MIAALRLMAAGGTYVHVPREVLADAGAAVAPRRKRPHGLPAGLSERQLDVLRLLIKGYPNGRIASELDITESTVKQHAHEVYSALGATTRAEAVVAAARRGLRFA
jgi:DNA-binding NarL/FixJ family response regulator